jgi:hypothetical protein
MMWIRAGRRISNAAEGVQIVRGLHKMHRVAAGRTHSRGVLAHVLGLVASEETLGLDLGGGAAGELLVEAHDLLHADSIGRGADCLGRLAGLGWAMRGGCCVVAYRVVERQRVHWGHDGRAMAGGTGRGGGESEGLSLRWGRQSGGRVSDGGGTSGQADGAHLGGDEGGEGALGDEAHLDGCGVD